MSDIRRTILMAMTGTPKKRAGKIWHKGKWHDPDSDDLPVWIRPRTKEEIEANERGMRQWLADAAADPRTKKVLGGVGILGVGTYGATEAMSKRRKAND